MKSRSMSSLLTAALLMSAIGGVAAMPALPEPRERTKRPQVLAEELKSKAQKKRERKNAKRSRNGAKS